MELRNFIDGKFIDSISKKNIPVLNPANQKIVGNIDEALDEEIDLAFQAAKRAFDKRILVDMGRAVRSLEQTKGKRIRLFRKVSKTRALNLVRSLQT